MAKLNRFESLGILNKMKTEEFSMTPIALVLKPNDRVRICGDYKVTINQYLDFSQYVLTHIKKY